MRYLMALVLVFSAATTGFAQNRANPQRGGNNNRNSNPSAMHFPPSTFNTPTSTFNTPTSTFNFPSSNFNFPTNTMNFPTSNFRFPQNSMNFPTSNFNFPTQSMNFGPGFPNGIPYGTGIYNQGYGGFNGYPMNNQYRTQANRRHTQTHPQTKKSQAPATNRAAQPGSK